MPPWIADDKKLENDLERLSKTDPATLRAKVMELESQVNELNQLLTYREDVILRIHEVSAFHFQHFVVAYQESLSFIR